MNEQPPKLLDGLEQMVAGLLNQHPPQQDAERTDVAAQWVLFGAIVQWKFSPKQPSDSDNQSKDDTTNEPYLKDKRDPINQIIAKA